MLIAPRLYTHANDLLWCVISSYEYLRQETRIEEVKPAGYKPWFSQGLGLAWIVVAEANEIASEIGIFKEEALAIDDEADEHIFRWSDALQIKSTELQSAHPKLYQETILYYHYLLWLRQVLDQFKQLMHKEPLYGSNYFGRYQSNRPTFDKLAQLVDEELQSAEDVESVLTEDETTLFWQALETHSAKLAEDWRESVISSKHVHSPE